MVGFPENSESRGEAKTGPEGSLQHPYRHQRSFRYRHTEKVTSVGDLERHASSFTLQERPIEENGRIGKAYLFQQYCRRVEGTGKDRNALIYPLI